MSEQIVISNPRRFFNEIRLTDDGLCPTLNATDYKDPPLAIEATEQIRVSMSKCVMPINTDCNGMARTLKAQYYKTSQGNLVSGTKHGATGVAVIYELVHDE